VTAGVVSAAGAVEVGVAATELAFFARGVCAVLAFVTGAAAVGVMESAGVLAAVVSVAVAAGVVLAAVFVFDLDLAVLAFGVTRLVSAVLAVLVEVVAVFFLFDVGFLVVVFLAVLLPVIVVD